MCPSPLQKLLQLSGLQPASGQHTGQLWPGRRGLLPTLLPGAKVHIVFLSIPVLCLVLYLSLYLHLPYLFLYLPLYLFVVRTSTGPRRGGLNPEQPRGRGHSLGQPPGRGRAPGEVRMSHVSCYNMMTGAAPSPTSTLWRLPSSWRPRWPTQPPSRHGRGRRTGVRGAGRCLDNTRYPEM